MEKKPLVSVLINNYNNGSLLKDCVESVLIQGYSPLEVIIYDDGSTDDSLNYLDPYLDQIQLIAPGKNYGSSANFNQANAIYQAFQKSKGELIFLLDGDDVFFPGKIDRVCSEFAKNPNVILVQHRFQEKYAIGGELGHIRPIVLYDPTKRKESYSDYMMRTHSLYDLFMQTSGLTFRREYLAERLPIKEDGLDKIWADVRLTRQAPFFGEVVTIQEPLTYYLIHEKNDSKKLNNPQYLDSVQIQLYSFFNTFLEELHQQPINRHHYLRLRRSLPSFWQKKWRQFLRGVGSKRV